MTEPFIEITQDDLTDSEMMDIIREKVGEGWSLSDYKYQDGTKTWVFEKEEAPSRLDVIGLIGEIDKDYNVAFGKWAIKQ